MFTRSRAWWRRELQKTETERGSVEEHVTRVGKQSQEFVYSAKEFGHKECGSNDQSGFQAARALPPVSHDGFVSVSNAAYHSYYNR
jgi:hypothetical protein